MQPMWFVVIVLLPWLGQNDALVCQPKSTCAECLRTPGCDWCSQKNFLKAGESNERRCDSAEALKARKCHTVVPDSQSSSYNGKNRELGDQGDDGVVQLKPQTVNLDLRIGQPLEVEVNFQRAEGYPIDLYYLMDLSFSMKDDLDKIKNLGQDILLILEQFTKDKRIGFGSFVDKVALPYVSQLRPRLANPCPSSMEVCQPAFSFRNVLRLTKEADEFKDKVSQQKISGNLDAPEAGLDAIMQAAVCQGEIGWRNVNRILVYTSDDTFHMAGDGKLAGIYKPHDGRCHLDANSTYDSMLQDYPSVGHLAKVLKDNNIQLIFAVTETAFPAYKELSKIIPRSVVGVLKDDSSNVVQLISDAYGNLSSSIVLQHEEAPAELDISYRSLCEKGQHTDWSSTGTCSGVKLNQLVNFTVRFNATACVTGEKRFKIKVQGISDTLTVAVKTKCDCECEKSGEEKAEFCNYNGTLACGICSCDKGYLGQRCECQAGEDRDSISAMLASCQQTNTSSVVCNGHGRCECGTCTCTGSHRGQYCECDDTACPQHDGKLCNGKGTCNCSVCECNEGYTGEKCHCPVDKGTCKKDNSKDLLCSGQGECPCDHCQCNAATTGTYCDRVRDPCGKKFLNCTLCHIDRRADCEEACKETDPPIKLEGQHELDCIHEGITFGVDVNGDNGHFRISYADLPKSIDKTYVIIGSSIAGILVIGIVCIIVYRLLVELYDLKEYRSFLRAQEQTDWKDAHNPLFKGAVTTVMNPLHDEGDEGPE
ncbi:integrin beta-7-like [Engraulis encrasicolus]|uniref:integrin beta-7-like n=1 Tax=Engraulis encrasicolus TaxID=184585 RepID=UPI002FD21580